MTKTYYNSNFYRIRNLGRRRVTILRRPRVGEAWLFVEGRKKQETTGFKAASAKMMETLASTGVIISTIENMGKAAGFAYTAWKSGFKVAREKAVGKFLLVSPEKEANRTRMVELDDRLEKILENQKRMNSDISELKKGMTLLLQDGKPGSAVVRGKGKGGSDSDEADKKNGGGSKGDTNGGANGGGGSISGPNGAPNGLNNGGLDLISVIG